MRYKRIEHRMIGGGTYKYCRGCDEWVPVENFYIDIRNWDGLRTRCYKCGNKMSKQWQLDNPKRVLENVKKYQNKYPERLKEYRIEHRKQIQQRSRKYLYGITKDEVDRFYLQQNGLCGICQQPLQYNKINVEHSHQYNEVRGLVHKKCNVAIGQFEDNVGLLQRAMNYLIDDYEASNNDERIVFTNYIAARKKYLIPLLTSQDYKCLICQRNLTPFDAVIEHNHTTNLIRSASCQRCNNGLALFNDDIGLIGQAIQYLIETEYRILVHGGVIERVN